MTSITPIPLPEQQKMQATVEGWFRNKQEQAQKKTLQLISLYLHLPPKLHRNGQTR
jgi:hypothetical protein